MKSDIFHSFSFELLKIKHFFNTTGQCDTLNPTLVKLLIRLNPSRRSFLN